MKAPSVAQRYWLRSLFAALCGMMVLTAACSRDDKNPQPGAALPLTGVTLVPATSAPSSVVTSTLTVHASTAPVVAKSVPKTTAPPKPPPKTSAPPVKSMPAAVVIDPALLNAINAVRQNPPAYAARLQNLRSSFSGLERRLSNGETIRTTEGWAAVAEAIQVLQKTSAMPALAKDSRLYASAQAHVSDLGPRGLIGHNSSNGESFSARIARYLSKSFSVGENIQFGSMSTEEVIMSWLIDDGIYDRGHRAVLLTRSYNNAGTACGPHALYGTLCVADFAQE